MSVDASEMHPRLYREYARFERGKNIYGDPQGKYTFLEISIPWRALTAYD